MEINSFIAELTLVGIVECRLSILCEFDILHIQLYRCYMVWNRSKRVLICASFLVLADSILAFLGLRKALMSTESVYIPLYLWSLLAINMILTGVIGESCLMTSETATS